MSNTDTGTKPKLQPLPTVEPPAPIKQPDHPSPTTAPNPYDHDTKGSGCHTQAPINPKTL